MSAPGQPSGIVISEQALTPQALEEAITARLALSETERHQLAAEAKGIAQALEQVVLATPEDATRFQSGLSRLATVRKTLEHRQQSQAGPLHKAWKQTRDFWAPGIEWCKTVEAAADRKMLAYATEQRRKAAEAAEAARKAAEEAQRKRDEEIARAERARTEAGREKALAKADKHQAAAELASIDATLPDTPTTVRTAHGTGYIAERWTYKITDPSLLPREFLLPDTAAIKAAVDAAVRRAKATGGPGAAPDITIPGVSIYADEGWRKR